MGRHTWAFPIPVRYALISVYGGINPRVRMLPKYDPLIYPQHTSFMHATLYTLVSTKSLVEEGL